VFWGNVWWPILTRRSTFGPSGSLRPLAGASPLDRGLGVIRLVAQAVKFSNESGVQRWVDGNDALWTAAAIERLCVLLARKTRELTQAECPRLQKLDA
jgi:hypothetical protein